VHDAGKTSPQADHAQTLDRRADLLDVADALRSAPPSPPRSSTLPSGRQGRSACAKRAREA